ncbi:hypothetical protein DV451_003686 [Geotrichum candidum]|uniref:Golgi SNAP receptor complex member 1 n=1 Tax=Geotrichum candidum TaxID=1173061 RepID=A0A9P5G2Q0_GEOCN|nr:hypothetical protein DV451_003686 [Geotrichum candidum]KAI9212565.1 hypothetical protein DS838_002536 [Geotrichum bryndzae]KAF5111090.1 hypothetical protein DV453_000331 [Geotrichum candidum]KAF5114267.1 hypothetical protein DV454_003055 [Geotrichum candidum]KAF5117400.1 hypothetical protein DV452_002351 [Geotrichum candidum]
MPTFGQLRTQARSLETETETLLSRYAGFAQSLSASVMEDENKVVKNIEENLRKLYQVQRHREVLAEHRNEFNRIRSNLQHDRNHLNLLSSVREDITQHQQQQQQAREGRDADYYLMNERNRIDNSNSMADSLLAQAYETRDEFVRQRTTLSGVQRRLVGTLSNIPGINTIIAKVNTRKKRDSLILASLITFCVLLILFFH